MTTNDRPATGPALMERLLAIEAMLKETSEEARQHWARDEERMQLIDRFMDPQLRLDMLLKQIFDALERSYKAVQALERAVHDEHRTTRAAIALHLGDPGQEQEQARG